MGIEGWSRSVYLRDPNYQTLANLSTTEALLPVDKAKTEKEALKTNKAGAVDKTQMSQAGKTAKKTEASPVSQTYPKSTAKK